MPVQKVTAIALSNLYRVQELALVFKFAVFISAIYPKNALTDFFDLGAMERDCKHNSFR